MAKHLRAVVHEGKIELLDPDILTEGEELLVSSLDDAEASFFAGASEPALEAVWDNTEDDVYAQLLEE